MGGNVSLKNLKIKPEALRDLNLPITVKDGVLGYLSVQVPWTSLWSSPTRVVIEDVYILAVGKENKFDDDFEKRLQITKERFLQLRELMNAPQQEAATKEQTSSPTWTQQLITSILNNLQVTVNRVHIRYEGGVPFTENNKVLSCGISLGSVSAVSCDAEYRAKEGVTATDNFIRKLCSLESLSAYFDCNDQPLSYSNAMEFAKKMKELIGKTDDPLNHQYILRPVSANMRIKMNQDPNLKPADGAKIQLQTTFKEVEVQVHESQYQGLMGLMESFTLETSGAPYRRLRPKVPVKGNGKKWFQFVVNCVVQDIRSRRNVWSWEWVQKTVNDRRDYVRLWCMAKLKGGTDYLDAKDKKHLAELDARLEYDSIAQFRELGEVLWDRKREEAEQAEVDAKEEGGWIGRVVWGTPQSEKQRVLEQDIYVNGRLLQELNRTILLRRDKFLEYQKEIGKKGFVKMKFDFVLERGAIKLNLFKDIKVKELAELEFTMIQAQVSQMASGGMKVGAQMGAMTALDHYTVPNDKLKAIQCNQLKEGVDLLSAVVELEPRKDGLMDISVKLDTRSIDVLFSMPLVVKIGKFFQTHNSVVVEQLLEQAQESVATLQQEAARHLLGIVGGSKTSNMKLDIRVEAPVITIPSQFGDPDCIRAVAVLGVIELKTIASKEPTSRKDGKTLISLDYFYQQSFQISVSKIQLLMVKEADWRSAVKGSLRAKLLEDISVDFLLRLLTFPTKMLPKIQFSGSVPGITCNVCSDDLINILTIINSLNAASEELNDPTKKKIVVVNKPVSEASGRDKLMGILVEPESGMMEEKPMDDKFVFAEDVEKAFDKSDNPSSINVKFSLEKIDVVLFRKQGTDFKDIVVVRSSKISLTFAQRKYDLACHAHVARLGIEDCICPDSPDQKWMVDGMTLSDDEVFLRLTYTGVPSTSARYNDIDHDINVKLWSTSLNVNRKTVLHMQGIVAELQRDMAKMTKKKDEKKGKEDKLLVPSSNETSSASSPRAVAKKESASTEVGFHKKQNFTSLLILNVSIRGVEVRLNRENGCFVTAKVSRAEMYMDMKNNGTMSMESNIGSFEVDEPSAFGRHKWSKIAYTESKESELIEFNMETFLPEVSGYDGYDTKIGLTMTTINVVYKNIFIEQLVGYFNEMEQMKQYISSATAQAVENTSKNSGTLVLDVTVMNPYIKVPESSHSENFLLVDLGKTTVQQKPDKESGSDLMQLCVNGIEITSSFGSEEDKKEKEEVDNKKGGKEGVFLKSVEDVSVFVTMPGQGQGAISVIGVVSPIHLVLSNSQAELLFGILGGNMSEHYSKIAEKKDLELLEASAKESESSTPSENVSSAPSAPQAKRNPQVFEIKSFRVAEIGLTLENLFSCNFEKTHLSMLSGEGKTELSLKIQNMNINDETESSNAFKEMLGSSKKIEVTDAVQVGKTEGVIERVKSTKKLSMREEEGVLALDVIQLKDSIDLVVFLNPVRAIFVPPCLVKILEMQQVLLDKFNKSMIRFQNSVEKMKEEERSGNQQKTEERTESESEVSLHPSMKEDSKIRSSTNSNNDNDNNNNNNNNNNNEQPKSEAGNMDSPPFTTSIRVQSRGLELFLLENLAKEDSRAFAISVICTATMEMTEFMQDIHLEINDVSLSKTRMNRLNRRISIMSPWRSGINYQSVADQVQRIDIIQSPLELIFAHSDYTLAMAINTKTMQSFAPETESQREEENARAKRNVSLRMEPSMSKRESNLFLEIKALAPAISLADEPELSLAFESQEATGSAIRPLKLSPKQSLKWVFKEEKILWCEDNDWGLGVTETNVDNGTKVALIRIADFEDAASNWVYYKNNSSLVRLFADPKWVLHSAKGSPVLWQVGADKEKSQTWNIGRLTSKLEENHQTGSDSKSDLNQNTTKSKKNQCNKVECMNVLLQGIKCRIVDDSIAGQIEPLLYMEVKPTNVFLSAWSSEMKAVMDTSFHVDHFDTQTQTWEPVVRGLSKNKQKEGLFDCQITASKMSSGKLRIDLVAVRPMTITFTKSSNLSLKKISTIWAGTEEDIKKYTKKQLAHLSTTSGLKELLVSADKDDDVFHHYIISNRTGISLKWAIDGIPEPIGHERGNNVAFWNTDPKVAAARNNTLSIYAGDGKRNAPLFWRLPIDGSRVLCFRAKVQEIQKTATFVYEIRYELGSRVLDLRSNMVFMSNIKSEKVNLSCKDHKFTLNPGSAVVLPVNLYDDPVIVGEDCQPRLYETFLKDECQVTLDGVLRWNKVVTNKDKAYALKVVGTPDVLAENVIDWQLTLAPPLKLKNLLCVDITVVLYESKVKFAEIVLKKGEEREIFRHSTHIQITVMLSGDKASNLVQLTGSNPAQVLVCPNAMTSSLLEVFIDHVMEGFIQTVSFWTSFWLLNNSTFSLTTRDIPRFVKEDPVMYSGNKLKFININGEAAVESPTLELARAPTAGTNSIVTEKQAYELGIRVFSAPSNFWRTQIVQIDDRFQIVNLCDLPLCIGQVGSSSSMILKPMEQKPFHWWDSPHKDKHNLMRVKIGEEGWVWSGAFALLEVSLFEVMTYNEENRTRITIQTITDPPVTAVIFRPSNNNFAIYSLINHTRLKMVIKQVGAKDINSSNKEIVDPKETVPYAWPEPSFANPRLELSFLNGEIYDTSGNSLKGRNPTFSLDTVEDYPDYVLSADGGKIPLMVKVYFKGPSKVFEVSEAKVEQLVAPADINQVELSVGVQLGGISISLINGTPQEILNVTLGQITALYELGTTETQFGLDIQRIQMDSMLYNSLFPVVFWPRNPDNMNYFHVAVNIANEYKGITFFNGIDISLQEAELRVDEGFATHLFGAITEILTEENPTIEWDELAAEMPDFRKTALTITDMIYCRDFTIGPIRIQLSYLSCHWAAAELKGEQGAQIEGYLGFINNIDAVYLELGNLQMKDAYYERGSFQKLVLNHYNHEIVKKFYALLGAVPVLGAPVEMFRGISTGVTEVFYLPAQGLARSPNDFGDGFRKGSSALFEGTIGTLFKEVGKVTTVTSKVVAKATLDDEFQTERDKVSKQQAKGAGQGVLFAARDVGKGIFGGLTGVIMNPIRGAQKEGVSGFGKGLGTGLIGIVTKPVVGVLDASSQISNGIKNSQKEETFRVRRPRQFDQTGIVFPYNERKAEAQEVLRTIDNSVHGRAIAVFLYPELGSVERNSRGKTVDRNYHVLVSSKAVFYLEGTEIHELKTDWRMPLREIGKCMIRQSNIVLVQQGARDVVREIKMSNVEEAHFVLRKIQKSMDQERDLEMNSLVNKMDVSTVNLLSKLNERDTSNIQILGVGGVAQMNASNQKTQVDVEKKYVDDGKKK